MKLNPAPSYPRDSDGDDCPICNRLHRPVPDGAIRRPFRVLVAEDEPSVSDLIAYNLELDRHRVDCVGDGDAALRALRGNPPDLLVLDLLLPLCSGWHVLREIRADPEARVRRLPVLVVSALACNRLSKQLAEYGAEGVLGKPFSVDELRRAVRGILVSSSAPG